MRSTRLAAIAGTLFVALLFAICSTAAARYGHPNPGDDPETGSSCDGSQALVVEARDDLRFHPANPTIQQGDSICFRNVGDQAHNVDIENLVRCSNDCENNNDPSTNAWEAQVTFEGTGTVDYHCDAHVIQGMSGTITVEASAEPQPGSLSLVKANEQVDETAGQVTARVDRSGGTDGAVSVDIATSDGSATAGEDYTAGAETLNWGDGDGSRKTFSVPILDDASEEDNETFSIALSNPGGGATLKSPMTAQVTIADDDVDFPPCEADADTLCFFGDRYQVDVVWDNPNDDVDEFEPANAREIDFTDRGGVFVFFDPQNPEFLIKVLNGCSPSLGQHYWVFFAATTNVEFEVRVTDTLRDERKVYTNPPDHPADAILDTAAFDTCP